MLTRLKVSGFKNLDVDVRFGPFTCISGPNGVGKSNLFDAIGFLSALADKPLIEAAAQVRGARGRVGDVRALFCSAGGRRAPEMRFLVELIVPKLGIDDLGVDAEASMTFLRYELRLQYRRERSEQGPLAISYERMVHINKTGAKEVLGFRHTAAWRDSVLTGRRAVPYIETIDEGGQIFVKLRADSADKHGGRPRTLLASRLPRTVLSTANNAAEHRTLVLARKEMMGWTQLQLEPSALRSPDPFHAPRRIDHKGAHLPATLHGLARDEERAGGAAEDVYQQVANRLAELFEDVRTLRVDADEKREQYAIILTDLQGAEYPASVLSDGTLRFLALSILEASPQGPPLLCLEEPENGIHPDRIPAMIQLLRDIAVDVTAAVGDDNPMRQVIVNTHSPLVVQSVPEDTLLLAQAQERLRDRRRDRPLTLQGLSDTWRADRGEQISLAPLISYLDFPRPLPEGVSSRHRRERRVIDREDIRQLVLFTGVREEPA